MAQQIKRIGVLTGGGDCPGLNAVIRGVVKSASNLYQWEIIGIEDGFEGLIKDKNRPLTQSDIKGILTLGGTILGTTNRGNPFDFVDQDGVKRDLSSVVLENIKKLSLDGLVVIGGDGSLAIANQLYKMGAPVVGVPKTIDNDLSATDVTFGFDTAVNTARDALDKLHSTAESHHRVLVLEVMGRYAGWIALHAGIAGGADVILIPEIPFDRGKVCDKVRRRFQGKAGYAIAVVAEGAKPLGEEVITQAPAGKGRLERLGGIGNRVGNDIAMCMGGDIDVRVTVLGHIQRGGTPSAFDRILGTRFGYEAIELIARGEFGKMVCLKGQDIQSVALEEAVSRMKTVPPDGQMVKTAEALGISFGR
ncbi:MAG: ATP-dependent 6-phosphofructokinase [Deltaproteobacteria bacterium]|nr:ATP-dependent 6-phosphofructokinase [Deltaproteobacteria bacterium]